LEYYWVQGPEKHKFVADLRKGKLHHMTCFGSQCRNSTSLSNFARLDLFFQNEANVSPWFLFGMKKRERKNNQKMTLPLHLIIQPEHTDQIFILPPPRHSHGRETSSWLNPRQLQVRRAAGWHRHVG
jgi:hypothetical protein